MLTALRRDRRILIKLVLALLVIYAGIAAFVFLLPTETFDVWFSRGVQRYQSPWLDQFMLFISWFATTWGGGITVAVAALAWLLAGRRLEAGFMLLPLLVVPIVSVIKQTFGRMRPTADMVRVIRQFNHESFPSGHVVFYTVFFGFLAYVLYRSRELNGLVRRVGIGLCVGLIALVPFSRMYLGAHWFTDVLAGFILGLILLIGLAEWYSGIKRRARRRAAAVAG